jgi:hypothetical protein
MPNSYIVQTVNFKLFYYADVNVFIDKAENVVGRVWGEKYEG